MKKIKCLLLIITLIFTAQLTFAQKVIKNEVSFDYKRLPAQPITKSIVNYDCEVILKFKAEIDSIKKATEDAYNRELADYPNKVKQAELKFEADKKDYEIKKKEAEDKYNKEMEEYNKKSVATKFVEKNVLEENNKPVLIYPSQPYLATPSKPVLYYPDKVNNTKVFDADLLENTYLILDGFTKSPANAVKITVTMSGFEYLKPELKFTESTVIENGASRVVRNYYYETSYKHPMTLKIETPDKGVIYNQVVDGTNSFTVIKTNSNPNQYALNFNEVEYLKGLQDKIVESNMKKINEFINTNYGYSVLKRNTTIFTIEPKNFAYDEYTSAHENVLGGYNHLVDNFSDATTKIQSAITSWEKAYAEADPTNKKARINLDVTIATLFNLVEANIWINNFDGAEKYLNKLYVLELSKKEKASADEYKALLTDQKKRFEVNK